MVLALTAALAPAGVIIYVSTQRITYYSTPLAVDKTPPPVNYKESSYKGERTPTLQELR